MDDFIKITEQSSLYDDLEKKDAVELVGEINCEDQKVAVAIESQLLTISELVDVISRKMLLEGGRLFYIGAGTSGRLGVLDASECPPTYGVPPDLVIGIIAGGDRALRHSVEHAEDSHEQAWKDLEKYQVSTSDVVVGIAASGTTPYVLHGLKRCRKEGITTGSISCNPNAPISANADYAIECVVGPEYVTGSTRMKSGTAQKMVLNMISTATMIKIGRVKGNRMVDMQLSNDKLVERGITMIMEATDLPYSQAKKRLQELGSVRNVLESIQSS